MANQGFNVSVGQDGGQAATVTIFGLREVDDRTQAVDPSNVSGNISVLLDVQYNDETVTNVDLTLGEEVISCRGASSDAASPTGVLPGLAESGGSVEIECFFDTDQVAGECTGMQMAPRFANGEHELSAQITTSDGSVRQALASQMITLKNTNYVMIDHNPGSVSHIVGGVTFYGGPTTEENVNTFDVCPVAFDGTMVGKIGLRGMTDTVQEEGDSYNDDLSFRTHRSGRYGEYNGVRRVDDEAPFTFTVLSSQNALTEDRNAEGHGGHWIIQDGVISDPDGLDISDKFVPGDAANDLTKIGPIYFDFASPRVSESSQVVVELGNNNFVPIENKFYSGKRNTYDGRSQRLRVSGVTERGAGGVADVISVGDCSVGANTDTGERGAGTAFQAIVEDAAAIGDLPEDDPDTILSDDGGVECYTAELQSLVDRMGNSRNLSRVRIQSAENFGVDKTPPAIEDLQPDEELVLMDDAMLTFEVDDPELETGEDGSGINTISPDAYWGPNTAWRDRYFYSGDDDAEAGIVTLDGNENGGVVTIATNTGNADADKDRKYVVVSEVRDNAVPPNTANAVFTYTRDSEPPGITLSKSQSDIGNINTATITVGVGGKISDKNVIRTAELSIRDITADGAECSNMENELSQGRTGRTVRNKRDVENDSNEIQFDESFTIRQPTGTGSGPETYCFWLDVADVAVAGDGRGDGNTEGYELGSFSVGWPDGPAPPDPGPTFTFTSDGGDAAAGNAAVTELKVPEGTALGTTYTYWVHLSDEAPTPTVTAPVNVTITPAPGLSVSPETFDFWDETLGTPAPHDSVQVQISTTQDLDIVSNVGALTHSATGFDDAALMVTSTDDDFLITTDVASIEEDDPATEVTVTVTAGTATSAERTVAVDLGYPTGDAVTGAPTAVSVIIAADATSGDTTVNVDALNDVAQDEVNEEIALTVSGSDPAGVYYKPASIAIVDNDPDVTLTATINGVATDDVYEDAGTITVVLTATANAPLDAVATFNLADALLGVSTVSLGGTASDADFNPAPPTSIPLTINARETTGTATVTLTLIVADDGAGVTSETLIFWDKNGASGVSIERWTMNILEPSSN